MAGAAHLLVFGDSLSAGYGIRQDAAWPALLQQRLAESASIIASSMPASREKPPPAQPHCRGARQAAAGDRRHRLGANDGLRGLPVPTMKENLAAMIRAARAAKSRVVLVGMRLPPNYGPYADEFHKAHADLARSEKVAPFPSCWRALPISRDCSSPTPSIRRQKRSRNCSTTCGWRWRHC